MGDPKAFLNIPRQEAGYRPLHERISDYGEVEQTLNSVERRKQASRCMDCGVPFCHWACPLGNKQPEWQDLLYKGRWEEAYKVLEQTCDFPEFTGRICPALCEKSCVLRLSSNEAVTIRENEVAIIEGAFREGFIQPITNIRRNGKRVAVIGSGPAGLTVANQLNRMGYEVTVYEKHEAAGGLLRYGIPNFKLHKPVIDRRIRLMEEEGIVFKYNVNPLVSSRPSKSKEDTGSLLKQLKKDGKFDAICLCTGAETPRDLAIPGRELEGIHFAMEMLAQQNRILAGMTFPKEELITAKDKKILVIGGGDTGSDCIGTSVRHKAASITQIEIMPKPPVDNNPATPWPTYPQILKTTSSHEEGCTRRWSLTSNKFLGKDGKVTGVEVEEVEWIPAADGGFPTMKPTGRKEIIEADMVLLAMGFLKPAEMELPEGVFMAGDLASGASLVVKAMASGRRVAGEIDKYIN